MSDKPTEMSIWMHLDELRKRILHSLIALVVGVVICIIFADFLLEVLARPIGGFEKLLSIQVTENFSVYFRVTLLGGFIIVLPFILLQLFLFVAPGLSPKEKRWVLIAVPFATALFITGAAFAYFVMLPAALPFLIEFPGPTVLPKWKDYVNFVTSLIFWIGLSFETPLIMYLLAKLGIVSAKGLLKAWRVAVIGIAVIAAVATPTPDPINMVILMVPLLFLYFLGVLLAAFARKEN
ncbi:MAG: twin-arginine translocase subunit TatC [Brevefilum sp.]|nr:twin-arginine translocase subunit TatC [Brevefilum sp.]